MNDLTEIENRLQEQSRRIEELERMVCPFEHDYQRSNDLVEKIIDFSQGRHKIQVQHFVCSKCRKKMTRFIQEEYY